MLHRSHETAEVNKKIKNKTGYKITNNYLSPYLMSKVLQFVMMIVMKTGGIQIVIIYNSSQAATIILLPYSELAIRHETA